MVQYGNMFSCVVSSAATRGCSGFQISHDRCVHACAARGVYLLEYVMGQGPYMVYTCTLLYAVWYLVPRGNRHDCLFPLAGTWYMYLLVPYRRSGAESAGGAKLL